MSNDPYDARHEVAGLKKAIEILRGTGAAHLLRDRLRAAEDAEYFHTIYVFKPMIEEIRNGAMEL